MKIPCSLNYQLRDILGNEVQVPLHKYPLFIINKFFFKFIKYNYY